MAEPSAPASLVTYRGQRVALYFVARFVLLAAALSVAAVYAAGPLTQKLLPLFQAEIQRLDDTFRIDRLYVGHDGSDQVLRIEVGLAHPLTINGRTFRPDPRGKAEASTLLANVTLPCVLFAAVALAWPIRSRANLLLRVLAAPAVAFFLCMSGAPVILLASIWGLLLQSADPQRFSALLLWSVFLLNGGAVALAMTFGAALGHLTR